MCFALLLAYAYVNDNLKCKNQRRREMTKIKKRLGSVVLGLLMALGVGVSIGVSNTCGEIAEVKAESIATTYTLSDKKWTTTSSPESDITWTSQSDFENKFSKGACVGSSNEAIAISSKAITNVSKIEYSGSILSKGAGTYTFSYSDTVNGTYTPVISSAAANGNYTFAQPKTCFLKISVKSTSGTPSKWVYLKNFTITADSSTAKITDLKITGGLDNVKKIYRTGELFDPTGLEITATYDDSTTENVANSVVWPASPLTEGTTSVTGTYKEKTVVVDGLTVITPVLVYTLDGTETGGDSNYNKLSTITQNNIEWKVQGNTTANPWRIGGKSLTNVNIPLYSQTSLNYNVTAIDIDFGDVNSITVNSLALSVHDTAADAASGSNAILSATPTFKANSTVSINMLSMPQSNKFYRMVFNVTVSVSSSNKYLQLKAVKFYGTPSVAPSLTVTNKPSDDEIAIGDVGQFACSTENATNPVVTWVSSSTTVIDVRDDGTYEALSVGKATISATLTCDESSTPLVVTFDVVVNYGSVTIEEANAITNSLSGTTVTADYYLTITGYITNLDADGNTRMIVLSDKKSGEDGGNQINVFGIYSDNALRDIAIINGTVTIKGKPAKYNGAAQLASPSYLKYTDDAIDFATMFNSSLKTPCANPSADNSASVSLVWSDLGSLWENVDSYAQAKLKAATTSDSDANIKNFAGLYDHIVNRYDLSNFVGRTLTTSSLNRFVNRNESRDLTAFIVFASVVGVASIGGLFLIRKRRRSAR